MLRLLATQRFFLHLRPGCALAFFNGYLGARRIFKPTRSDLLLVSCLQWRLQKVLHQLILVLLSLVGSSFLRFAYVVAGAVMLRMLRCVSLSSLRLCGAHVVGGCCTRMPTVGFWSCLSCPSCCRPVCSLLSSVFRFCFSLSLFLPLSLSASASGKPHQLTERI